MSQLTKLKTSSGVKLLVTTLIAQQRVGDREDVGLNAGLPFNVGQDSHLFSHYSKI